MEHDHPLTDKVAVRCPADALATSGTELEEAATKGARMRHPQVRPELHEQFDESRIVGEHTDRPAFDLGEDALIEVLDGVRQGPRLADSLTLVNAASVFRAVGSHGSRRVAMIHYQCHVTAG